MTRTQMGMQEFKLELAIYKHIDGRSHVKSKHVARETELSVKQAGQLFSKAEDRGWVERAGRSTSISWRIEI